MTGLSLDWYIKLKTNFDVLPWYIESGAEMLVMPETLYKKLYGDIHSTGRTLFVTGKNSLHTLGCFRMELSRRDTTIQEDVYVVRGVKTLLLGQPAIEKLGLIPNIPVAYRIRAVNSEQKESPSLTRKMMLSKCIPNYTLDSVN